MVGWPSGQRVCRSRYRFGNLKHPRANNAFANSATNCYKRLVAGYEARVMLANSASNRSVPHFVRRQSKGPPRVAVGEFASAQGNKRAGHGQVYCGHR